VITLLDINLSLLDFVPESIRYDLEIIALSLAIDPELRDVGAAIIQAVILPRITSFPGDPPPTNPVAEAVLDELAWACRYNELLVWDNATFEAKREMIAGIFTVRKRSGTRFALQVALGLLSLPFEIVEWFEESAPAFTYRVRFIVGMTGISLLQFLESAELTRRFESTRSQLRELAAEADQVAPLNLYSAFTVGHHTTIQFGP
jgi:hypothetical protein